MNFHGIERDSMLNGEGLRVVLWVSGCENYCKNCHNPQTWDVNSGRKFTFEDYFNLVNELNNTYISGLTISGGDPFYSKNIDEVFNICQAIKEILPQKTIWIYTGYNWEDVKNLNVIKYIDVLVDGKFIEELADVNYPYAGSTNQRVIDVKKSLEQDKVVLWRANNEGK